MTTKKTTKKIDTRPKLIQVGKHLINPNDIACISRLKKGLFIIKRISEPNPMFPIWVSNESELEPLLKEFNIIASDIQEDEEITPFTFGKWD